MSAKDLTGGGKNPFLQAMERRCNPHAPCPAPESCNADRICIYRCQWFADNAGTRAQLAIQAAACQWSGRERQPFTPDELGRAERALERYRIETNKDGNCAHRVPMTRDCSECGEVGRVWFPDDRYARHTVDLAGPAPVHVEDEALAFERGWRRAKVAWAVLLVLGVGYVVWRLW